MKKRVIIALVTIMIIGCMPTIAYADADSTSVTYEEKEIMNADVLDLRLENNINEAPQEIVANILESSEISIADCKLDNDDIKITTQKLSETVYADNIKTDYVALLAGFIDLDKLDLNNIPNEEDLNTFTPIALRAKETKEERSPSLDGAIYCKIYFTTGSMKNAGSDVEYMKLDKVTGTFRVTDSSCKLKSRQVRGGYSGYNLNTNKLVNSTSAWTTGTGETITRSISGPPLETPTGIFASIWGESECTIERYSQSWPVKVRCGVSSANIWW